ncbi:MAG: NAD-dependent epimerase/dehydratase family protein [Desulfobaccales bacterium]
MMRVVVTGASGFIARYLLKELVGRGYEVVAVTRAKEKPCTYTDPVWHLGVDYRKPDQFITPGTEAVIHLAAVMPDSTWGEKDIWCNLSSTYACYTALFRNGGNQFIFASSQMVYGSQKVLPVTENALCRPNSAYGLSKLAGEAILLKFYKSDDLRVSCLRFAEVFGLGQERGYVRDQFIKMAIKDQPITLFGHYRAIRDFIYVKDAVRAIRLALESCVSGVFNVGGGKGRTVEQYAQACHKYLGTGRHPLQFGPVTGASDPPSDFYMSIEKAREAFGYQPDFDLAEAMADIRKLVGCAND